MYFAARGPPEAAPEEALCVEDASAGEPPTIGPLRSGSRASASGSASWQMFAHVRSGSVPERPRARRLDLTEEHGTDLLTKRDVRRLLRYGRFLRDVIKGEAGYWLRIDQFYDGERPDRDEMLGELEALLRKAGWDPEREEAPPSS